ncbi:MAG TPA: hypothetical protein VD767_11680 [Thermomicrobiales bacterium]|nr:hypothetical protein [Thermomicrobiales bacterium]
MVERTFSPRSPGELIDAMCAALEVITGDNRVVTTARLVLFMEASHNPTVREALSRGRGTMEAAVIDALAGMGARDPLASTQAIAACFEGLTLHRIARHVITDPRPVFETVVLGAFAGHRQATPSAANTDLK